MGKLVSLTFGCILILAASTRKFMRRLARCGSGIRLVVLVGLVVVPGAARAVYLDIDNGLDCLNPGNVIDHDSWSSNIDYVNVYDAAPGAPTEVCVVDGGDVYALTSWDSSTITMSGGEVGEDLCADFTPPGCVQSGCPQGQVCDTTVGCVPSICACDPATGGIICTADCGGGTCVPEPSATLLYAAALLTVLAAAGRRRSLH